LTTQQPVLHMHGNYKYNVTLVSENTKAHKNHKKLVYLKDLAFLCGIDIVQLLVKINICYWTLLLSIAFHLKSDCFVEHILICSKLKRNLASQTKWLLDFPCSGFAKKQNLEDEHHSEQKCKEHAHT